MTRPAAPPDYALEADVLAAVDLAITAHTCWDCIDGGRNDRAAKAVLEELQRAGLTIVRES